MDMREVPTYKGLDGWLSSIMENFENSWLEGAGISS
jgi:hypothetical protein